MNLTQNDSFVLEDPFRLTHCESDTAGEPKRRQQHDLFDQVVAGVSFGVGWIIFKAVERLVDTHQGGEHDWEHLFRRTTSSALYRLAHNLKTGG